MSGVAIVGCSLSALLAAWTLEQEGYQDYTVRFGRRVAVMMRRRTMIVILFVLCTLTLAHTHMSCAPF